MIDGLPKDIIITTGPLVGLGDHLLYSTLPERFAKLGHTVWLDQDNFARNDEVLDVVWQRNPYISGLTDRKPNAGHARQGDFYDLLPKLPGEGRNLEAMERVHGLPPPYSIAPKIYYEPKPYHLDLSKAVLWDYSALSSAIADHGWHRFMQKVYDRFSTDYEIILIQHKAEVAGRRQLHLDVMPATIGVTSLYQYIDMIAACHAWVGSESGMQAVAAAIRGEHDVYDEVALPQIMSLMAPGTRNSAAHTYRGVWYKTSKFADGDDYLEPAEVHMHRYEKIVRANGIKLLGAWRAAR